MARLDLDLGLHVSVSLLAEHLLFAFVLIITPIWDYYDTQRLKRNSNSENKIRYYKTLCSWLWITSVAACAAVGLRSIFMIRPDTQEATWLFQHLWVRYLIVMLLSIFTASIFIPIAIAGWKRLTKQPRKYSSADMMQKLSYAYVFPATCRERRWYAFLAITAGICEEIVFRGFLLHYLHVLPWKLDLTVALLISSFMFGLQHLYQGIGGAVSTVLVGALLALFFLLTRNLLFPIALHAIMDLRLLTILRPAAAAEP